MCYYTASWYCFIWVRVRYECVVGAAVGHGERTVYVEELVELGKGMILPSTRVRGGFGRFRVRTRWGR